MKDQPGSSTPLRDTAVKIPQRHAVASDGRYEQLSRKPSSREEGGEHHGLQRRRPVAPPPGSIGQAVSPPTPIPYRSSTSHAALPRTHHEEEEQPPTAA